MDDAKPRKMYNFVVIIGILSVKYPFFNMNVRRTIQPYARVPLTHTLVQEAFSEYNRPNDKIHELIQSGDLIALRRGLYVPGENLDLPTPHLFLIANHLRGPSYVSCETALAYWGLIPERVEEISSVTLRTAHTYTNALGRFTFRRLRSPYYSFGLRSELLGEQQRAVIASPEKALCDTIILTSGVNLRSVVQTRDYLLEDMRLDESQLQSFDLSTMHSWLPDAPKRASLSMLINTIERL